MTETDQAADSGMMQRLRNPEVDLVYFSDQLFWIESPESRFFDEWERLDQAIITAPEVRAFSQSFYARLAYCYEWCPRLGKGEAGEFKLCWKRRHPEYLFEGLRALSVLFAAETFDAIKFRLPDEFAVRAEYPAEAFKMGDTVCSYRDWRQGFVLALLRFGAIATEHPVVKETVCKYSSDMDFIRRYTKEVEHGPRVMIGMLRRFAKDWDVSLLPLRYFTHGAALDFVAEQYGYPGRDIKRFRVVFLKGGNENQRRGLKLTSAKPSIVWRWNSNLIRLDAPAAAHHGYNAELLQKMLAERYKRRVSL